MSGSTIGTAGPTFARLGPFSGLSLERSAAIDAANVFGSLYATNRPLPP